MYIIPIKIVSDNWNDWITALEASSYKKCRLTSGQFLADVMEELCDKEAYYKAFEEYHALEEDTTKDTKAKARKRLCNASKRYRKHLEMEDVQL